MASGGSCFNVAMLGPCLMSTKRWICLEYEFAFCIYIYIWIYTDPVFLQGVYFWVIRLGQLVRVVVDEWGATVL